MCGRYSLTKKEMRIQSRFAAEQTDLVLGTVERYNIGPTQLAPAILVDQGKLLSKEMRFGMQPAWSKAPIINAQSETIATKPTFKDSLARRRCLVPADGFYEWKEHKIPMRFVFKSREPFCFAGIWQNWSKPNGENVPCFAILTTRANSVVAETHHRMPLVVAPDKLDSWLDPQSDSFGEVLQDASGDWECYRVSDLVNKVSNQDARCIEPATNEMLIEQTLL
ncbi:MAG: SOS response-associated peptidase [Verrucomicrobiota bacterium]